jgi:predicted enzyme related to lactoylglutathione lyase
MANPFVHVELLSNDPGKAKEFYSKLFNWKLEDVPGMDYTLINVGEGTGGGIMKNPIPNAPSSWLAYVLVDNAVNATQKVKELGGRVLREVTEIPNIGSFSVVSDPTGAVFALWQQMPHQKK